MKQFLLPIFCAACTLAAAPRQFDLGQYTPADAYSDERGYGFDLGTAPNAANEPYFFSVAVSEGNYCVTVTFGDPSAATVNTVKAESRRLMLDRVATAAGEFVTRSFIVNVRNASLTPPEKNAPGGSAVILNDRETGSLTWDDKLTLEFNGSAPGVRTLTIEPVERPTVYLAGDSTVTDQRWEDGASWGQMLPRFFRPGIAVANHAESGETLKSFLTGLRLAKVLDRMHAGDYLFIQFGHNDQKKQWPQTYVDAKSTYQAYLRAYIAEARLRGATPVLLTSPQRRTFDAHGKITNTHGDYPAAVREVGAEQNVVVIDLAAQSAQFYEALGPDRAPLAFSNHGKDATHHNNYGAYELAKTVAQAIRDSNLPLARELIISTDFFFAFDPAQPDDPATFNLPASPHRSTITPRGN